MTHSLFCSSWIFTIGFSVALSLVTHSQTVMAQSKPGRLVIIGGGLDPANKPIYQALLEAAPSGKIGVVPLASGVPEESGPLTVQDLRQYDEDRERIFDTALVHTEPQKLNDPAVADQLRQCSGLWFTGGDQSRIIAAMRPVSGDSAGYTAVVEVHHRGDVIGGTSAGAAMMSDPMIRSGYGDDAMLLGATTILDGPGVCIGRGMGLFNHGIVDQHFSRRGRFCRLLVALEASETNIGFGVSENSAIVSEDNQLTTVGSNAVTIIDRSAALRSGMPRVNIRVHLLGSGDRYDLTTNEIQLNGKVVLNILAAGNKVSKIKVSDIEDSDIEASESPHDDHGVRLAIHRLARQPGSPVVLRDEYFVYTFSDDAMTRFGVIDGLPDHLSAANVRLDITPLSNVDLGTAAEQRRRQLQSNDE